MIVERTVHHDDDKTVGYIECIFDSSSILLTTYFPKTKILYVSFKRGMTYRYDNVDQQLYDNFEKADSQGKFFQKEIKNNDSLPYSREFELFEIEKREAEKKIAEWKEKQESPLSS
jgi:hypothetical protein